VALMGYALIFSTFGVVGGWAAIAKLDRAVSASGVVSVETNRKTVQHLEGGIIREIAVKEGQTVAQGATLFQLENVQAKANFEMIQNQLYTGMAAEARIVAERDQKSEITWPESIEARASDPLIAHVMADQIAEFDKRRSSLESQVGVLESRMKQLEIQIQGIDIERESTEKQVEFIDKELVGLRELNDKHLVPVTRLYTLERERERLQGAIGQSIADSAKSRGTIGEYKIQVQQLHEKFQEEVASALVDIRQKIGDATEKLTVTKDVLRRVEVVAPVAGTVQNLKVFTVGQVVRAGEPLLDIVPQDERLVVEVQFSPTDIDGVYAGQEAEVRFPAFHSRLIPLLLGHLENVSRDRLVDEATKQPYYKGIVVLDNAQIPEDLRARVRAGMPAEVIVASGERTVLSYFVSPLTSTLRKAFIQ
jgi:HlyD family secretion protein